MDHRHHVGDVAHIGRAGAVAADVERAGPEHRLDIGAEEFAHAAVVALRQIAGDRVDLDLGAHRHRAGAMARSEEHTSELQSRQYLVCRLLLEKKKKNTAYSKVKIR